MTTDEKLTEEEFAKGQLGFESLKPGKAGNMGLLHLNGNMLCAIDLKTTGPDAGYHDIIQICVLPLQADLTPMKGVNPFYTSLKPSRPENINVAEIRPNVRKRVVEAQLQGIDSFRAADYFIKWYEKFGLREDKKISPLSNDWPTEHAFMKDWLGPKNFRYMFDVRHRDVQSITLYRNDVADFMMTNVPFTRTELGPIANVLKVEYGDKSDTLCTCVALAECYKRIMLM